MSRHKLILLLFLFLTTINKSSVAAIYISSMKGLVFLLGLLPTIYASLVHITPASEDDFYNPPAGFESAKNGDILKLRNS